MMTVSVMKEAKVKEMKAKEVKARGVKVKIRARSLKKAR